MDLHLVMHTYPMQHILKRCRQGFFGLSFKQVKLRMMVTMATGLWASVNENKLKPNVNDNKQKHNDTDASHRNIVCVPNRSLIFE